MKVDKYEVVVAEGEAYEPEDSVEKLNAVVARMLEQGWEPLGGVSWVRAGNHPWASQAMVRRESEDKPR